MLIESQNVTKSGFKTILTIFINRNGRCDIIYFAVKVSNNSRQINVNGVGRRSGRMCAMYDSNKLSANILLRPKKINHVISSPSTIFYPFLPAKVYAFVGRPCILL